MNNKIVILGGDLRITHLYKYLYNNGFNVTSFLNGINDDISDFALKNADTLILGMPVSRDKETLYAPLYTKSSVKLTDIMKNFRGSKVFGGVLPPVLYETACKDTRLIDYSKIESLMVLNAISTAEGAIEVIMKNTDFTLCSSNVLVIGNGRIGKIISKMLAGIGAKVTTTARKGEDFAYIESMGLDFEHSENLSKVLPKADVIVNTVPHRIIKDDDYRLIKKGSFIIDLASMPGYINKDLCKLNSIKFEHALSLPGKSAPKSAGYAIYKAILPYL